MKNKKIIVSIIVIVLIIIIVIASLLFKKNENEESTPNPIQESVPEFEVTEDMEVDGCVTGNCGIYPTIYPILSLETENELAQKRIKEINEETKNLYQETLNSNTNNFECINMKDTYKYSIVYITDYDLYTNDKYISINIKREKKNICSNEVTGLNEKTYIINKETNKEITTEEFIKENNITADEIEKAIQKNIDACNKSSNRNFTIENTYQNGERNLKAYFSALGEIYLKYKQNEDGNFYIAIIDKK